MRLHYKKIMALSKKKKKSKMAVELWTELVTLVEGSDQNLSPLKKKFKKANWLSEETLQLAEETREAKSKGEKERYTQLNAEFQTIARRNKKAFFNEQYKERKTIEW